MSLNILICGTILEYSEQNTIKQINRIIFLFLQSTLSVYVWGYISCISWFVHSLFHSVFISGLLVYIPWLSVFVQCLEVYIQCLSLYMQCLSVFINFSVYISTFSVLVFIQCQAIIVRLAHFLSGLSVYINLSEC